VCPTSHCYSGVLCSRTPSQDNTLPEEAPIDRDGQATLADLLRARHFIFDVDGCLALGASPGGQGGGPLPGAPELLTTLKERGARFVCCTNGSGRPPEAYAAGLRAHGLPVADEQFLTPPVMAAERLARERTGARVMVLGGDGVIEPLRRAGIATVAADGDAHADIVLVGPVARLEAAHVKAAARAIWAGAEFLVTSYVPTIPVRDGRSASVSAAVAAGLAHVTGATPEVVGKPAPAVAKVARTRMGATPDDPLVVVGDDPALDIALGRAVGAGTVLVLSGTAGATDVPALPPSQRPDAVVAGVSDLLAALLAAG
jgi:HAD superfamily hydrolase (TIGR01450 family)